MPDPGPNRASSGTGILEYVGYRGQMSSNALILQPGALLVKAFANAKYACDILRAGDLLHQPNKQ